MTDYQSIQGMISLGPWGGSAGGGRWSFNASLGIKEIVITLVENNIRSISFKDAGDDYSSSTFGGRDPNGTMGDEEKIEIDWPSDFLISISGHYGYHDRQLVIKSLSFITNLNKKYGPFGTTADNDTLFSIPLTKDSNPITVVGFHGRASNFVDALGIFVKPVDPQNGTISFGPWGGPGGNDRFDFMVPPGSFIEEITVGQGDTIYSIAFKDANGNSYGKFGGKHPTDTGERKTVKINGSSEHLTSISGTYADYREYQVIRSLSFITNLNTHFTFGTASGTSFTIPLQGSLVIGFHGRSGYFLDSIGIYVKPAKSN